MARSGASPQAQGEREQRLVRVAHLMLCGRTQADIAAVVGVDQSTVSRDMAALRGRWRKASAKEADRRIAEQYATYRALIEAHLPLALAGKTWNASVVMQALAQQAKLLGLDKPVVVENHHRIELQQLAERMGEKNDLDPADIIATAERIVAEAGGGT